MVPTLLNFALSQPEFCKENFGHIENILVGAAPVPPSAIASIRKRFGSDVTLQHGETIAYLAEY